MICPSGEIGPIASTVFYNMSKVVAFVTLDLFVKGLKAVVISGGIISGILISSFVPYGLFSLISSTVYSFVSKIITYIAISGKEALVPDGLPWCNILDSWLSPVIPVTTFFVPIPVSAIILLLAGSLHAFLESFLCG